MTSGVVDWSATDGEDDRKRDAGYLTDSILSGRGGRGGYRRGNRGGGMRGRGLPPRGPAGTRNYSLNRFFRLGFNLTGCTFDHYFLVYSISF